ncbi:MAG: 50S ribosomal protein L18a [Candidatus Verstraetearchaeota archaeon]|jgi:ribosomal protein L20A (L18A)|nr:50S ribosomal protein L18a [Candidatus Verstraetearchaeota archaeon]
MEEKLFLIEGKAKMGYQWTKFRKLVSAINKKVAIEKLYSEFGGNHKLKRFQIKIDLVVEKRE